MASPETPRILEDSLESDERSQVEVVACYDGSQRIW